MEGILRGLLHDLATAKSLTDVNIAAGIAHEQLLATLDETTTEDTNLEEVRSSPEAA